ncbi:MAG: hypothetical protein GXY55_02690 [Phycisphaerae bacterium]|nr:hypothetical protein [Phycisphaerae bacterium]
MRNVLPWCEAEKIPTHTAIITGPWQDPPVYPVAHRLQILLCLPDQTLPEPALTAEQAEYVDRVYAYETERRRRRLKGACNVVLEDGEARALLGPLGDEEAKHLAARFAAPKEYLGWHHAEFGPHTVSHRAFDGDVAGYLDAEVLPCMAAMEQAGLTPTRYLTLPMRPRYPATVEQLVPSLRSLGFEGVLDGGGEWDRDSFIVPRIDAKHVEESLGLPPYEQGATHAATCLAGPQIS